MEPNNVEIEEKIPENKSTSIEEFPERIKEEVEDGYIDDRGNYTTPNGSFWDENVTHFNHIGLDKHGGRYDEYGVLILFDMKMKLIRKIMIFSNRLMKILKKL